MFQKSLINIHIICFILLSETSLVRASGDMQLQREVTAIEVLKATENTLKAIPSFLMTIEQISETKQPDSNDFKHSDKIITQCRRDHERLDTIIQVYNIVDQKPSIQRKTRHIWDGERLLDYTHQPSFPNRDMAVVSHDKEKAEHFAKVGPMGQYLDGIFRGDREHFYSILRNAQDLRIHDRMEKVNDFLCYVIEGKTDHGHYKVWIDPQYGHLIRKVSVHKEGDDIYAGMPLSTPPTVPPGFVSLSDTKLRRRVAIDFELNNVEIKRIGDCFVFVSGESIVTTKYEDGKSLVEKEKIHRSDIDLAPDFEKLGAFVIDMPNGTKVFLEEAPGIPYTWQDGCVVDESGKVIMDCRPKEQTKK